jgi:hypothetical protein
MAAHSKSKIDEGFKRIHLRFPPQAVEQLEALKKEMGASSYVEVLKTALGLLHWALEHLRQGGHIAAVYKGEEKERIVLPGIYKVRK